MRTRSIFLLSLSSACFTSSSLTFSFLRVHVQVQVKSPVKILQVFSSSEKKVIDLA